jgi:hypothetical protein
MPNRKDFSGLKAVDKTFSDESMHLIRAWYEYYSEFFLSCRVLEVSLSDDFCEELPFILGTFCEFCYRYHLQKPGQWTTAVVWDVCENIMPRKMVADDRCFLLVTPVLCLFLKWMSSENYLPETAILQQTLHAIEKNILENARNPSCWGMGKTLMMMAKIKGENLNSAHALEVALRQDNRKIRLQNNKSSKNQPKRKEEIRTIDDIAGDLCYLTTNIPVAALNAAIKKQKEITPVLLTFLNETITHYQSLEDRFFGYVHALFLLAFFREKQALPLVIALVSLPEQWPETLLGDIITEDLHRIIGSIYDGNIETLQQFIENPTMNAWSRNAVLRTLLVLVKAKTLTRSWVIRYLKTLFYHHAFVNDVTATTHLVNVACDLYPDELYGEIKMATEHGRVDAGWIDLKWVDFMLSMKKKTALAKYIYNNPQYDLIDHVMHNLASLLCFRQDESCLFGDPALDFHNPIEANVPYYREIPNVGRNEACPCGSGKKYKACCLLTKFH